MGLFSKRSNPPDPYFSYLAWKKKRMRESEIKNHAKKKSGGMFFLEYDKYAYVCRFCGFKFNAKQSFVCPQCKRTN